MNPKAFFLTIACAANAVATLFDEDDTGDPGAEGTPKRSPGRPRKPAADTAAPAQTQQTAATPQEPAAPTSNPFGAKSYEEMRALIMPLVDGGKGLEVKTLVAKYTPGGLKELPLDKQAAFAKDVEALSI